MGFLPLFVAILGLVLLYSIYTYNQIKPRKANVNAIIDQMAVNHRERKQLILEQEQSSSRSELMKLADKLKRTSTDRFQSFKKEEEFLSDFENVINAIQGEELAVKLKAHNDKQAELTKALNVRSKEYNSFISKSPAKAVASVFGFKPF